MLVFAEIARKVNLKDMLIRFCHFLNWYEMTSLINV